MLIHPLSLILAFWLDLLLGDPRWLPHPICLLGNCIARGERWLRPRFPSSPKGQFQAGATLAICLCVATYLITFGLLLAAQAIHPWLGLLLETLLCYQILAARCLRDESMKVYRQLMKQDLPGARQAVSMIVGRDTQALSAEGVTRAAVETVAENTSDGVVAPLFFMALGGAPLALTYKAINTMDSMLGYKNETYLYFGRFPALLDDAVNFLPARLSGLLMCLAAPLTGLDGRSALRIFLRDRRNHASPNSAHTEAATAGALHVQLAGDASYFGQVHHKPTIGNPDRPIEPEDIPRTCRLMYGASFLAWVLCAGLRLLPSLF
ncbi:MAG: adenosylcobinamide-phosphate synthase CbiB [Eubacteriales bacterium]|jgi:adenosylcobinamide-phosphate synthase